MTQRIRRGAALTVTLAARPGGGEVMRTITVYRVDYVKKTKVPIGGVKERRKKDRGGNLLGLLRLARKIYGISPEDAIHIAVDTREARQAWMEHLVV